jgi:hypothetical protein
MKEKTKLDNEIFEKCTEEDRANAIDFDEFTVNELKDMIDDGDIQREDVTDFYNNEWWDQDDKWNNREREESDVKWKSNDKVLSDFLNRK